MAKIIQFKSPLAKKIKAGFRGYPIATIAFYGPDNKKATKVVVGVFENENQKNPVQMEKWFSNNEIRTDIKILNAIKNYITKNKVRSVVMGNKILGCPHEAGIDYPEGESCPQCPFWDGRDRFTDELIE